MSSTTNAFLRRFERNIEKVEKLIKQDMIAEVSKDARKKYREIIDDYYEEYDPIFYGRPSVGLYDLLVIEGNKAGFDTDNIGYDPSRAIDIESEAGFKEYLYDITFRQGYHGGADKGEYHPSPGTPLYRTPQPYEDDKGRWHSGYYRWGAESIKSNENDAPLDRMHQWAEEYRNTVVPKLAQELFRKHAGHLMDA